MDADELASGFEKRQQIARKYVSILKAAVTDHETKELRSLAHPAAIEAALLSGGG
jgi:hypothetical protein